MRDDKKYQMMSYLTSPNPARTEEKGKEEMAKKKKNALGCKEGNHYFGKMSYSGSIENVI